MSGLLIAVAVAVIGAAIYGFAGNPKAQELGKVVFTCGFFWLVWLLAGEVLLPALGRR